MRNFFELLPGLVAHDALHARRVASVRQKLAELGAQDAA